MVKMINYQVPVSPKKCESLFVCYGEENYPQAFYDCQYPPLVLFYEGNLSLLNNKKLAVVGSRDCSNYAYEHTKRIVSTLSQKYVIVSGLAKGIDGVAHQAALQGKGTVGFLGCGIHRIYPAENRELIHEMKRNHLVMSEYHGNVAPKKHHFPWRNRLIVAAGDKLCVMAARVKSGTMHSVNEAVLLDREIYCLPYDLDDSSGTGCLEIVNSGASLLTNNILDLLLHEGG